MRLPVLFFVAGAMLAQAPSTPTPVGGVKPIGTMSELMLDVIYPTSDAIFYVASNENKKEKDWIDLRRNSLMLAEAANLLMADNRARDKGKWMQDAQLLWDVGDKAYAAAKARDEGALEALNSELYEACQACHVDYRPGYKRRP